MKSSPKSTPKSTPKSSECNAPDCTRDPVTRGLCAAHYNTHRGLADPKEQ